MAADATAGLTSKGRGVTRTILMIHGYGMTGQSWAPAAEALREAGYEVETPTLSPGLRTAQAPPPGLAKLSLADYVAEAGALARAATARGGAKPVIFGHSMGGLIAQKLAENGLASGIVLFAPASPADARGPTRLSAMFTFLNAALTPGAGGKPVRMWKTGFKFGVVNAVPAERHEALYALGVHDSGRVLQDMAYPDRDPARAAHVDAARVDVPVLVLGGGRDRTTPIDDVRLVGRKYEGADYREYESHGHWLIDEPGSPALYAAVKSWLADKGLGPALTAPKAAQKAVPKPKTEPETGKTEAKPRSKAKPVEPAAAAPAAASKPRAPAKAKIPARAKAAAAEPGLKPASPKAASSKTAAPKAAPKASAKAKPAKAATSTPAKTSPRGKPSV